MASPASDLTPGQLYEARRRKVRKGTHSCWECRRRKIRCQFASPDDVGCIGCQSRGTPCRSQEFADEKPSPSQQQQQQPPEKKVALRLERLESMMEQLMTHIMAGPSQQQQQQSLKRPATPQHSHWPSSAAQSVASDTTSSEHQSVAAPTSNDDHDTVPENDDETYKNPLEIVARTCPKARARQGYGMLDVLDTSTADDTPVAALLGIHQSLSGHQSDVGGSAGGSAPNSHNLPYMHTSNVTRSVATALGSSSSTELGVAQNIMARRSSSSPINGPGRGKISTNESTADAGLTARVSSSRLIPERSDAAATAGTEDSLSLSYYTRPLDPVSEEWRRHQHLSRLLSSLYPSQEDINTIMTSPPAQYVASLFYTKDSIDSGRYEPLSKLREVPPWTSHPSVIARRLLQITLCMQQAVPCFLSPNKLHLAEPVTKVMDRIVGIISHTVASNDELIGSLEGLQCLILLGQLQSNAGQLRKAWLSYRRALSLAQLMDLDRGNIRALKSCDPTSDPRWWPTPVALWYRVNSCDRYLSLLLGLRAGCQDDDGYATSKAAAASGASRDSAENEEPDTPVETLEKAHTILTGRIIERNLGRLSLEQSYAVTQAIDAELWTAASRNLDSLWWELPLYNRYARPDCIYDDMCRSVVQINHHCILILLHLPYMLRGDKGSDATTGSESPSVGTRHSYEGRFARSKATCLQSSRAVLCRFMQLRQLDNAAFACRHIDYASLIAAMTLIIGYLARLPPESDPNTLDNFDSQLQQDCALVEQVRERLEHIGRVDDEKLSRESAATIKRLMPIFDFAKKRSEQLRVESTIAESAAGQGYSRGGETFPEHGTSARNAGMGGVAAPAYALTGSAIRLNVPDFGTVNIHTDAPAGMPNMAPHFAQHSHESTFSQHREQQQQQQYHFDLDTSPTANQSTLGWNNNLSHRPHESTVDLNAMMIDSGSLPMTDDSSAMTSGNTDYHNSYAYGVPAYSDMTGPGDDWVLQGVDATYWSLLNGAGGPFGG
ncbi:hypothetical protein SEPCBS119000_005139 [Sporothrix epigloea]|uniref:Zn(2)-C6 fungal-type domain-containing protein n=1 Tax=Sporothrix epigloea TaxID=1892477 RepID=A0ABP0DW62_9PEZI